MFHFQIFIDYQHVINPLKRLKICFLQVYKVVNLKFYRFYYCFVINREGVSNIGLIYLLLFPPPNIYKILKAELSFEISSVGRVIYSPMCYPHNPGYQYPMI